MVSRVVRFFSQGAKPTRSDHRNDEMDLGMNMNVDE